MDAVSTLKIYKIFTLFKFR